MIFAEAMFTRTIQWVATVNAVSGSTVLHRVATLRTLKDKDPPCSLQDIVEREWPHLLEQLQDASRELFNQETQDFISSSESEGDIDSEEA